MVTVYLIHPQAAANGTNLNLSFPTECGFRPFGSRLAGILQRAFIPNSYSEAIRFAMIPRTMASTAVTPTTRPKGAGVSS